jgi:hypothetical protein
MAALGVVCFLAGRASVWREIREEMEDEISGWEGTSSDD